jgi:ABC-type glycerol-3-phosphate transport system substrate-binding protein
MLPPPPRHDATLDEWLAYLDKLKKLPPDAPFRDETIKFVEGTIERISNERKR